MEFRFTLPRDIYVGHGAIKTWLISKDANAHL